MARSTYLILLLSIAINVYGQKKQALPTLKSDKDTLDIRYNDYLDEQSWILSSKKKIDVLELCIRINYRRYTQKSNFYFKVRFHFIYGKSWRSIRLFNF